MTPTEASRAGAGPRVAGLGSQLAVSAVARLLALLCAEIGARRFLPRPRSARIHAEEHRTDRLEAENSEPASFLMPTVMQRRFISETPTVFRPLATTVAVIEDRRLSHSRFYIRTNSYGFRGPELGDKEGTRVLFLCVPVREQVEAEFVFDEPQRRLARFLEEL